jgi:hypothetical protein
MGSTQALLRLKRRLGQLGWRRPGFLLLLLAGVVAARQGWLTRWGRRPVSVSTRQFVLKDAPFTFVRGLTLDPEAGTVKATGPFPAFALARAPGPPGQAIASLALSLTPLGPFNPNDFVLFFTPAAGTVWRTPDGSRVERGRVEDRPGGLRVLWNLSEPAVTVGVSLPPGASFRLDRLEVTETDAWGARGFRGLALALLVPGLLVGLGLLAARAFWPRLAPEAVAVKQFLLLGLLFGSAVTVFLLPPFQGPDEWVHWRTALALYRPDFTAEPELTNLESILGAERVRFRAENQFHPDRLRAPPGRSGPVPAGPRVAYANPLTYLAVGVVALAFPHVETVREALVFYYLCRMVPLAVLFALLFAANRRDRLPYTAIIFFSSPLVVQQYTAVSADTVPNLATLAAALLLLGLWRRPSARGLGLLAVLCLVGALAKPPALAGLLLLPCLCLRLGSRRPKMAVVILAGLAVLAAGLLALGAAGSAARQVLPGGEAAATSDYGRQLAFVQTGAGLRTFLAACANRLRGQQWLVGWFQPLGWVDTGLSEYHLNLIRMSVWVAVLLDAVELGPALLAGARRGKGRAALLAVTLAAVWLFLLSCLLFIFYLLETPPGALTVVGLQTRYLIPAAILTLLLPLAVASEGENAGPAGPARQEWLALNRAVALGLLPLLLAARQVELTTDLLLRYW